LQYNLKHSVDLLFHPTLGTDIVKVDRREGNLELGNVRISKPLGFGGFNCVNCPKDENADAMEHIVHTNKTAAGKCELIFATSF
jgi:hypothetical protein